MTQKKLNLTVDEGIEFFAHELSINFNPTQFVFDFKSVTPRIDFRSNEQNNVKVRHNVILVDPFHAKMMLPLLQKVVEDYEKRFGEIEKPKAMEAWEKEPKPEQTSEAKMNYFG